MQLDEVRARLRSRLAEKDAPDPGVTIADALTPVEADFPPWWRDRGNLVLAPPGEARLPRLIWFPGVIVPTGAIVVLGGATPPTELLLFGEEPIVVLGQGSAMGAINICCGNRATVAIGDDLTAMGGAHVDARHGGLVSVGRDGMWAGGVRLLTDDMHPIRDATGRRLNPRGGTVIVEEHVWLGLEALVLGGSHIGAGSVVGARGLVKGHLPGRAVCAGSPAKAVRRDITWDKEDLP